VRLVAALRSLVETVEPARKVHGRLRLPGDKSISHRYALLAALADGTSRLTRFAPGADCAATLSCLEGLGVAVERPDPTTAVIVGRGLRGLAAPARSLDCRNSGSTLRMLSGVVAAHGFDTTLGGDPSLQRRPMRRVIAPLTRMGARIDANDDRPPLTVHGADLHGVDHAPEVPSAQVKSAVLLAGLQAEGLTSVREPAATRDHTERALAAFGAEVSCDGLTVALRGGQRLTAQEAGIPGDVSSATFWAVAAAALPESDVVMEDVGLNPTRTALFDVLRRAGALVDADVTSTRLGEPRGTLRVRSAGLVPLIITPDEVPGLIDELPALAVLGLLGAGMRVTGAAELRTKESDRITALVAGLRALGADADELPDGFVVSPARRLAGGHADAAGDHRLAMAFAIAALRGAGASTIVGADSVDVSYPGFFGVLQTLCA
jgi:3-phosphoshikimate 1-carboxyvinyltransferase